MGCERRLGSPDGKIFSQEPAQGRLFQLAPTSCQVPRLAQAAGCGLGRLRKSVLFVFGGHDGQIFTLCCSCRVAVTGGGVPCWRVWGKSPRLAVVQSSAPRKWYPTHCSTDRAAVYTAGLVLLYTRPSHWRPPATCAPTMKDAVQGTDS